ncbi:MAG: cobalt transporter CbiM [Planctomycetes bacterium]|nr:cobalt transporter CbiM [Planctomycetota bacterium]
MHIAEGYLSTPVLLGGAALAAGGVAMGLRRMDYERVPQVAVLSSALFVASLIHVSIGPTSTHLILNGLAGLILGWSVFPALLISLLLQAILFGYGGLTTLGVNTVNMALPGVICWWLFHRGVVSTRNETTAFAFGGLSGALAVALGAALTGVSLLMCGAEFRVAAVGMVTTHLPVMAIEGLVTGSVVVFVRKVRPELFGGTRHFPPVADEPAR